MLGPQVADQHAARARVQPAGDCQTLHTRLLAKNDRDVIADDLDPGAEITHLGVHDTARELPRACFEWTAVYRRSLSSVVREIVVKTLEGDAARERPTRINQFASVRAGRSKQGRLSPISEKHDEALAAAYEK